MRNRHRLRNSQVIKKVAFLKLLRKRIRKRDHGNKIIRGGIGMSE